ncbi:uncharacterized protein FFC1_01685 [Fusarium fujikuroi]|nr:uncharacterized protein FFC1_01685 [Fusarium fujikuroi]
MRYKKGPP